jgi:hypothetical protein
MNNWFVLPLDVTAVLPKLVHADGTLTFLWSIPNLHMSVYLEYFSVKCYDGILSVHLQIPYLF